MTIPYHRKTMGGLDFHQAWPGFTATLSSVSRCMAKLEEATWRAPRVDLAGRKHGSFPWKLPTKPRNGGFGKWLSFIYRKVWFLRFMLVFGGVKRLNFLLPSLGSWEHIAICKGDRLIGSCILKAMPECDKSLLHYWIFCESVSVCFLNLPKLPFLEFQYWIS